MSEIVIRGARAHNLRGVDVVIPRDRLVLITGPSGSGKSSLAFDTLYAEAQRRFVEGLSPYARQMLERLPRPDVDLVEGLSPAIAVQQQGPVRSPRSTVGTLSEVLDYLRLLFAHRGVPTDREGREAIPAMPVSAMKDRVMSLGEGARLSILAPIVRDGLDESASTLEGLRKKGFVRVRIDGKVRELGELDPAATRRVERLEVVVDRIRVREGVEARLAEALELAVELAEGWAGYLLEGTSEPEWMSVRAVLPEADQELPPPSVALFSFNSPEGACPRCGGLGRVKRFDPERLLPDPSLTLREGAVASWGKAGGALHRRNLDAARDAGIPIDQPVGQLRKPDRRRLLYGVRAKGRSASAFLGVIPALERRRREIERRLGRSGSEERLWDALEESLGELESVSTCEECDGKRLGPAALAYRVHDETLADVAALPLPALQRWASELDVGRDDDDAVLRRVVPEIRRRVGILIDSGLAYLSLDRDAPTLSGGETQRLRLATQIGAGLVGVLYVLDEPTTGLHPADVGRLLDTITALRDRGNTVVMVEHEELAMRRADLLIDVGPGAGREGGRIVGYGTLEEIMADGSSVTGPFLSGEERIPIPEPRPAASRFIRIRGASAHNLADVDVDVPVARFTCVTGVSGSGKSSLVMDTLVPAARHRLNGARIEPVRARVAGLDVFDRVVDVDQSQIGRTPRSSPATAVGVMRHLRALFATLPLARQRGYGPRRFSYNVKGGRCEACKGEGVVRLEMHFLPDAFVECDLCKGKRYDPQTLEVTYRGHSIADVLEMPVSEARTLFDAIPKIRLPLEALERIGLGYLELGRSAPTLSAGEAQRIKLARELGRQAAGPTLYVLDEPTRGLHFVDIRILVEALHALVDQGNTVVVVEHRMDVVKTADHVIDLGPAGGPGGGRIIAEGTPAALAQMQDNRTGVSLAFAFGRGVLRD